MNNHIAGRIAVVTGLVMIAGCSPAPTAPSSSASPIVDQATSASASQPAAPTRLKLGETRHGSMSESTVYETKRIKKLDGLDSTWAALVKTCITKTMDGPVTISQQPWTMIGPDQETYPSAYAELSPRLNDDDTKVFAEGECSKGWVGFAVPDSAKVVGVRYQNSAGDSATWVIP